jgi:DNA polymerase III subunit epsilon
VLSRLGGVLQATHAQPRLLLAAHPTDQRFDAFWLVGGRVADWGGMPDLDLDLGLDELERRTAAALSRLGGTRGVGTHVPPGEVDEVRIVANWLAAHPDTPALVLDPPPGRETLARFARDVAHVKPHIVA